MLADMSGLIRQASFFDAAIWFLKDNGPPAMSNQRVPACNWEMLLAIDFNAEELSETLAHF
jgi:hypothetical protein